MKDDRLIGQILELQSQRITRMQQSIDKLTTQIQANGDALERIHRSHHRRRPKVNPNGTAQTLENNE